MMPGKKGRLSPEVIDELMQFVDSQAAEGGAADLDGGEVAAPTLAVEIEAEPKGDVQGGQKMCPTCGHPM